MKESESPVLQKQSNNRITRTHAHAGTDTKLHNAELKTIGKNLSGESNKRRYILQKNHPLELDTTF